MGGRQLFCRQFAKLPCLPSPLFLLSMIQGIPSATYSRASSGFFSHCKSSIYTQTLPPEPTLSFHSASSVSALSSWSRKSFPTMRCRLASQRARSSDANPYCCSNPITAFDVYWLPLSLWKMHPFGQLVSGKHRQYRIDHKLLRHPVRHMVSEHFAGHDIPDYTVIHESLARSQVCDIACQTHSRHDRELLIPKNIRIPIATCFPTVRQALGFMPVVAGLQAFISAMYSAHFFLPMRSPRLRSTAVILSGPYVPRLSSNTSLIFFLRCASRSSRASRFLSQA